MIVDGEMRILKITQRQHDTHTKTVLRDKFVKSNCSAVRISQVPDKLCLRYAKKLGVAMRQLAKAQTRGRGGGSDRSANAMLGLRQLRSPTWHVPVPFLTGENRPDAALWREHLANRRRMGKELSGRGVKDVPWSSTERLLGVVMTCFTFGLWIVSGGSSIATFVLGGAWTRALIAGYAIASTMFPRGFSQRVYDYCARLEVGATNGWGLIVKGDVDCSSTPHLFCSHPHGLFCAGVSLNLILSKRALTAVRAKSIRLFVHSLLASVFPVVKDWLRTLGFQPCTAKHMRRALDQGLNAAIVPGGVKEVVFSGRVDRERLYLKNAFGFCKIALQTGAPLVPVYTFGESLSVGPDWVPFFELRRRLSYWADAPIRYLSLCQRWLLPFPNGRLVTVVGAPIAVGEKTERPTRTQVRELHARYCAALLELIESTKEEAGYGSQVIELV